MNKIELCDRIVLEEFKDICVIDSDSKSIQVPITFMARKAPKAGVGIAVANLKPLGYDILPFSIFESSEVRQYIFSYELTYCLGCKEYLNQVLEQIFTRFSRVFLTSKLGYKLSLDLKKVSVNEDYVSDTKSLVVMQYCRLYFDLVVNLDKLT